MRQDGRDIAVRIDLKNRMVFMDDGRDCPITNMTDIDGDETDDPDLAMKIVVKAAEDRWLVYVVGNKAYETE